MTVIDLEVLKLAFMESRDGISIADAKQTDLPLTFVNPAFERMTGFLQQDIQGKNCRFLQRDDNQQPGLHTLRQALQRGQSCVVTLRNYRKDGSLFWNELSLSPVPDASGKLACYLGIQRDVTARELLEQHIEQGHFSLDAMSGGGDVVHLDAITGLYNRRYFDQQLPLYWCLGQRDQHNVVLFMVEIDCFGQYVRHQSQADGMSMLRRVSRALRHTFSQTADFICRYTPQRFAILGIDTPWVQAEAFAKGLCERVRQLQIPNLVSPQGIVTVSVGFQVLEPANGDSMDQLLMGADTALYRASWKGQGHAEMAM